MGEKMTDIRNCVFDFKCAANWDGMKPTSEQTVRHCVLCQKDVYFISTPEELTEAINLNRCVAIAPPESLKNQRPTTGVPRSRQDNPGDKIPEKFIDDIPF